MKTTGSKMYRKMAFLLALSLVLTLFSAAGKTFAAERIYLKTATGITRFDAAAGQSVARREQLIITGSRSAYVAMPEFTIECPEGSPLSFSQVKATEKDGKTEAGIITDTDAVYLSYSVLVSESAKIGTYHYYIVCTNPFLGDSEDEIEPEKLEMTVTVLSEKLGPQFIMENGYDFNAKPGEAITLKLSFKNVGDRAAYNTMISQGYDEEVLTPNGTAPNQSVGTAEINGTATASFKYTVSKEAEAGRIKLPITISYKDAVTGETATVTDYYVFLNIKVTATPTPTPTPVPEIEGAKLRLINPAQSEKNPKAGENITVSFYLENTGKASVNDVKVWAEGLSSSTFEPISSDPYIYVGKISAGKKQKVELTLKVAKDIPAGMNILNIGFSYTDNNKEEQKESSMIYILDVVASEEDTAVSRPKLMVGSFSTGVDKLLAAQTFTFTFEVKNTNEETKAKNIKIKVTSNEFSVTKGSNTFFVNEILPGQSETIEIELKASAAATTGEYPINVSMEYEYEGMPSNVTGVDATDELLIHVDESLRCSVENINVGDWSSGQVTMGNATTLSFEFYNMGKSMLNNTYVTIEGGFMLANGNSYYLGNMAPGSPEAVECSVIPMTEGDSYGTIVIHMEDSNGNEVTFEKEFNTFVMGEGGGGFDPGFDPGMIDPGFDPGIDDPNGGENGEKTDNKFVAFFKKLPIWAYIVAAVVVAAAIVIPIFAVRAHKKNKEFEEFDD